MKILLVHISDIHLKSDNNDIYLKLDKFIEYFNRFNVDIHSLYFVISGDIVFSGDNKQYEVALDILTRLKYEIEKIVKCKLYYIPVPGNHDCFHDKNKSEVRNVVVDKILSNMDDDVSEEFIKICSEVNENYFNFEDLIIDTEKLKLSDNLLKIHTFYINERKIQFNCFNTSWLSKVNETPSKIFFPINNYKQKFNDLNSDISISIMHHPFNWHNVDFYRKFKELLEKSSSIIMTGHEHYDNKTCVNKLDDKTTLCVEGGVFQGDEKEESVFLVLEINVYNNSYNVFTNSWDGEKYIVVEENLDKKLCCNSNGRFIPNDTFYKILNDPGGFFSHPVKGDLYINDFFVFPDLKPIKYGELVKKNNNISDDVSSSKIINFNNDFNKILISGEEKSGKSTLCKKIYLDLIDTEFVPVLVNCRDIKKKEIKEFNKILDKCFTDQYDKSLIENFKQLPNNKKFLLIDNLDKIKVNKDDKDELIEYINNHYNNIVIFTLDNLFMDEMCSDDGSSSVLLSNFRFYELKKFGFYLRKCLIEKWNALDDSCDLTELEITKKNDNLQELLNTIVGKNFVPSYPFFLLIILQTNGSGNFSSIKESSYGYCYNCLIIQSLHGIAKNTEDIDLYNNYIVELSYYLFINKIREITYNNFIKFNSYFYDEYGINLNVDLILSLLCKSKILDETNGCFKFKYSYVRYYFVAKYLSNNINNDEIKLVIDKLCSQLHKTEFSNIIMFLTYHSKDPHIINKILSNAKLIFNEVLPVTFDSDIDCINKLIEDIPEISYKEKNIDEYRDKKLIKLDEDYGDEEDYYEDFESSEECNVDEVIDGMSDIQKLHLSLKYIEIIGQVLKNYYGSLKKQDKVNLGEETYKLGLRSLNVYILFFEKFQGLFVALIEKVISKYEVYERDKIKIESKRILFQLSSYICLNFIRRVSGSIGTEKLENIFSEILKKNNTNSVELIDISIKLNHFKSFPIDDIYRLNSKFGKNYLCNLILKLLVKQYLYMFPLERKMKQRVCALLNMTEGDKVTINLRKNKMLTH